MNLKDILSKAEQEQKLRHEAELKMLDDVISKRRTKMNLTFVIALACMSIGFALIFSSQHVLGAMFVISIFFTSLFILEKISSKPISIP